MGVKQSIRFSKHPAARAIRSLYYLPDTLSIPAPVIIVRPLRVVFVTVRFCYYFFLRVFIVEPIFKSYCQSYGKRMHTGVYIPWIQGAGRIIAGDDVRFDGKMNVSFAARYTRTPVVEVGSNTGLGHNCSFRVGKSITIGRHCRIASGVIMFDIPGHPMDAAARMAGEPAPDEDVRPIRIGDNVWIGQNCIIFPGVSIGDNSVVAMGSCVMTNVPPDTAVGGNPARAMKSLAKAQNV
jgi:acetyltransferase-like isoleucine patch superfamily enzyme